MNDQLANRRIKPEHHIDVPREICDQARLELETLISAVKHHAEENYNKHGWDVVIEAWTDEEIASVIVNCKTTKGAIRKMAYRVRLHDQKRQEIYQEVF